MLCALTYLLGLESPEGNKVFKFRAPPEEGPPGRCGTPGFTPRSRALGFSFCSLAPEETQSVTSTGVKCLSTWGGVFVPICPLMTVISGNKQKQQQLMWLFFWSIIITPPAIQSVPLNEKSAVMWRRLLESDVFILTPPWDQGRKVHFFMKCTKGAPAATKGN